MTPWRWPSCGALVRYEDYDRARTGHVFRCQGCGIELVIDRKSDAPVPGRKPPTKSS
jgi:hypothetical protein